MPMVALVASGSITGVSGVAAGTPTRLVTTATYQAAAVNTNIANESGTYIVAWNVLVTGAGSGAGGFPVPVFTFRDPDLNVGVSASGGAYGSLCGGLAATSVYGASAASTYVVSGVVSARAHGIEVLQCGSGASGVSAYLQVSALGAGGAATRFNYQVYKLELWGV